VWISLFNRIKHATASGVVSLYPNSDVVVPLQKDNRENKTNIHKNLSNLQWYHILMLLWWTLLISRILKGELINMTWVWKKEKTWIPDLLKTGWALYPLSYEISWRARSLNWVHATGILHFAWINTSKLNILCPHPKFSMCK